MINQRLNKIEKLFLNSIQTKELIVKDKLFNSLAVMGELAKNSIINGGKIMLCGYGGSAADAQHLAAELTVRLKPMNNREGIAAISLAQVTSTITACGNDFGFDFLYERLIKSLGNDGDCLIGITTSGNSKKRYSCYEGSQKNEY